MYYPCSENKGADQLRGYREADLRLCFRLCRLLVFPRGGSFVGGICIIVNAFYSYQTSLPALTMSTENQSKHYRMCSNLNTSIL